MSDELEQQSSDVSTESPSETPTETGKTDASAKTAPTEKYVPYERFQEVIQLKNEFAKKEESLARELKELRDQINRRPEPTEAQVKKENALIGRLKGIDPEFGTWAEQQETLKGQLDELKQWKAEAEQERLRSQADNTFEKLHTEHKVPKEIQEFYKASVIQEVQKIERSGKALSMSDLPRVYKSVHDNFTKFFELQKRANIANYASEKKADATVPAAKKGVAAKPTTAKPSYSRDPEEAKAQIVSRALQKVRQHNSAE